MAIKKRKLSDYDAHNDFTGLWTLGYAIISGTRKTVRVSLEFIKRAIDDVVAATKSANDGADRANTSASKADTATDNANNATQNANKAAQETRDQNTDISRIENERVEAEKEREKVFQSHVDEEAKRVIAESARDKAEDDREKVFQSHVDEEEKRCTAETGRVDAENLREKNTNERLQAVDNATDRLNTLSDNRDRIVDGYWEHYNEVTGLYEETGERAHGDVLFATFLIDPVTGILTMFYDEKYNGANFEIEKGMLKVII